MVITALLTIEYVVVVVLYFCHFNLVEGRAGGREVENRKLVQLVSILTNQIFWTILDKEQT